MKRYWKILSISLVALLTIGTFYIQSGLAAKGDVKIEFKKVSGDDNEVKNLIVHGDYALGNQHQSLQFTVNETKNVNNQSLFQMVSKGYGFIFDKLIDQHRNFMRGKDLMANYFFEEEKRLVYANIKGANFFLEPTGNFSFDIAVLNKKSKEITSIQLDVPEKEKYGWLYVEEVQVINDQIKVITQGYVKDGGHEIHEYTFNINQQKLVNDKTIISAPQVDKGRSEVRIINNAQSMQPEKYFLIKKDTFEDKMVQSDGGMKEVAMEQSLVASEILVYNIKTNQMKKLIVPEEILASIEQSSTIFDSTLFVQSYSEKGVGINRYDLEKEEWANKLTFDLEQTQDGDPGLYIKLMNGKIYIISSTKNGYQISIRDLNTGKSLYEGQLKVNYSVDNQKNYRLYIQQLEYAH